MSRFAIISNPYRTMKRLAFAIIFLVFPCLPMMAQQQAYFLSVQSDDGQPFYVRTAGKVYSSTSIGHLIISGCKDTIYNLYIGFPRNRFPEQYFSVNIRKKDHGYLLKNTQGQGFTLSNEQEVIQAAVPPSAPKDTLYGERKENDAFATLMSSVVNDSAVLYSSVKPAVPINNAIAMADTTRKQATPVITDTTLQRADKLAVNKSQGVPFPQITSKVSYDTAATFAKSDPPAAAVTDTIVAKKDTVKADIAKEDTKPNRRAPRKPVITRVTELDNSEGKILIFADASATGTDTIVAIIPLEKDSLAADKTAVAEQPVVKHAQVDTTIAIAPKTAEKKDSIIVKNNPPAKKDTIIVAKNDPPAKKDTVIMAKNDPPPAKKDTIIVKNDTPAKKSDAIIVTDTEKKSVDEVNKNCRNIATDQDVDKVRLKMMEVATAYERAEAAKKIFKTKCFTTQQVKALSELFGNDEGLYRFFETAYPYVSDTGHFSTLATLLKTEEYKNRFKQLTK